MVGMMKKSSQWWWLDNQKKPNRSAWLNSTLAELDEKTETILNLIEQDADSFAKRAEMYYQKRLELLSMVKDFYRSYRLLAERHEHIRSESTTRLVTSLGSPFSCQNLRPEKAMSIEEKSYDSCSDITTFDHDESGESEVDDPDEEEVAIDGVKEQGHFVGKDIELKKLREEIENLHASHQEELLQKDAEIEEIKKQLCRSTMAHSDQLEKKDEEKREVIRQLTYAMGVLKEENMTLKQHLSLAHGEPLVKSKKHSSFETEKAKPAAKAGFLKKLFNGSFLNLQTTLVAI